MAQPPKPENVENALRRLRGLLSSRGEEWPVTQKELSDLIDVPSPSIKAIEAGQRALTVGVLWRVLWGTGARWDGGAWVCAFKWIEGKNEWIWSGRKSAIYLFSIFAIT